MMAAASILFATALLPNVRLCSRRDALAVAAAATANFPMPPAAAIIPAAKVAGTALPLRTVEEAATGSSLGPMALYPDPLLRRTADEMGLPAECATLAQRHQFRDAHIEHIAWALDAERRAGFANGTLYADSLGTALAVHLLSGQRRPEPVPARGLTRPQLRRVTEHIEAHLDGGGGAGEARVAALARLVLDEQLLHVLAAQRRLEAEGQLQRLARLERAVRRRHRERRRHRQREAAVGVARVAQQEGLGGVGAHGLQPEVDAVGELEARPRPARRDHHHKLLALREAHELGRVVVVAARA